MQPSDVIATAWQLASAVDASSWFPMYRPFPIVGLTLDALQWLPTMQDLPQVTS